MAKSGSFGRPADASDLNFALGLLQGIKARDEAEAMLGVQMVSVHLAALAAARRLAAWSSRSSAACRPSMPMMLSSAMANALKTSSLATVLFQHGASDAT